MSRIWQFLKKTILDEEIELLLGSLARNAYLFSGLRSRLFLSSPGDSPEDLPSGTGQAEGSGKGIAPLQ